MSTGSSFWRYPYSDTYGTCSSITKVYGCEKPPSPCRLRPKNRDSTCAHVVNALKCRCRAMFIQNFARDPVLVNNRLSAASYRTQTLASNLAKSLIGRSFTNGKQASLDARQ